MKKLLLKTNQRVINNNKNIYYQETIKPDDIIQTISNKADTKKDLENNQILNYSFLNIKKNSENENPKDYSPSYVASKIELPKINNNNNNQILKEINNNSKFRDIKHMNSSNSSINIHSQKLFGLNTNKKQLRRDKTQITLIKEEESNSNFINDNTNLLNNNINFKNNIKLFNNLKYNDEISLIRRKIKNANNINNITNINIHIYPKEKKNDITQRKIVNPNKIKYDNKANKDLLNQSIENLSLNNKKIINYNDNIIKTISGMNDNNINNINDLLFQRNNNFSIRINNIKKNSAKKQHNGHSSSVDGNRNSTFALAGNIIVTKNNLNLLKRNDRTISKESSIPLKNKLNISLSEINLTQIEEINQKVVLDNQKSTSCKNKTLGDDILELEKIDLETMEKSTSFLIELKEVKDRNNLMIFLKLFQVNLDIEILLNSLNINLSYNNKNEIVSPLRQKIQLYISNDKQYKFLSLLNKYLSLLSEISTNNLNLDFQKNIANDLVLFSFPTLNKIFNNCIKSQICLYSSILISISQLPVFDFNIILKNYFLKIFKEISFSLINIFEHFIKDELYNKYSDLINMGFRNDFIDNYNKILKEHKIHLNKKREIIKIIMNNINKSVNSLKFYSSSNLKYSLIRPYGDSLNQLLFSFEIKTLYQFIDLFLYTILYGELKLNKKNIIQTNINKNINININFNTSGSSIKNKINDSPPYLPPISPKYKFTLVLDVDETLIHFFFTYINGMFFVRPYCFEFLNEINKYYEIVTFTAGTKDYADNILNLLDINDNLIKYRLYRQHTIIIGCNVFKDLTKLGRDLNRTIIIDNLKDNFKLQPNNGLFIKTWTSDVNDNQFQDLLNILKNIVLLDVKDVRPVIEEINNYMKITRNLINPYKNIDISKILSSMNSK